MLMILAASLLLFLDRSLIPYVSGSLFVLEKKEKISTSSLAYKKACEPMECYLRRNLWLSWGLHHVMYTKHRVLNKQMTVSCIQLELADIPELARSVSQHLRIHTSVCCELQKIIITIFDFNITFQFIFL
jgi:hypothetical protein